MPKRKDSSSASTDSGSSSSGSASDDSGSDKPHKTKSSHNDKLDQKNDFQKTTTQPNSKGDNFVIGQNKNMSRSMDRARNRSPENNRAGENFVRNRNRFSPVIGRNRQSPIRGRDQHRGNRESPVRGRNRNSSVEGSPVRHKHRELSREDPVRNRDGSADRDHHGVRDKDSPSHSRDRGDQMRRRDSPRRGRGRGGYRQNFYREGWRGRGQFRGNRGGGRMWHDRRRQFTMPMYGYDGHNRHFDQGHQQMRGGYYGHYRKRSFEGDAPRMIDDWQEPGQRMNYDYVSRDEFVPERSPGAHSDHGGGNTPPVLRELREEILNPSRWDEESREFHSSRSPRGTQSGRVWRSQSPGRKNSDKNARPKEIREIVVTKKAGKESSMTLDKLKPRITDHRIATMGTGDSCRREVVSHMEEMQEDRSGKKKRRPLIKKKKKHSSSYSSSSSSDEQSSEDKDLVHRKKNSRDASLETRLLKLAGSNEDITKDKMQSKQREDSSSAEDRIDEITRRKRKESSAVAKKNQGKSEKQKKNATRDVKKTSNLDKTAKKISGKAQLKSNDNILSANKEPSHKKPIKKTTSIQISSKKVGKHQRLSKKISKPKSSTHVSESSDSVSSDSDSDVEVDGESQSLNTGKNITTQLLETDEDTFKIAKSPEAIEKPRDSISETKHKGNFVPLKPAISPITGPSSVKDHIRSDDTGDASSGDQRKKTTVRSTVQPWMMFNRRYNYRFGSFMNRGMYHYNYARYHVTQSYRCYHAYYYYPYYQYPTMMYVQPEKKRLRGKYDDEHYRSRDSYEAELRSYQRDRQRARRKSPPSSDDKHRNIDSKSEENEEKSTVSMKRTESAEDTAKKAVDLITTKTGGAYIPPAKLREMQAHITDKSSVAYQRIAWETLKKSINGLINKVNTSNLVDVVRELLRENIVRAQGALCRSIMQAQAASPTFTHVYAALVAIINTKFPQTGELLLKRLIIQFRRGFRRNDKNASLSSVRFIAHLVNQQVAHEVLALQILTVLLETPTDDSVEVAVEFLKQCGAKLTDVSMRGLNAIFDSLRRIAQESDIDRRVQYMVEVMFAIRKDGFKDFQAVIEELDLVDENDQFTHMLTLDDEITGDEQLNVFKFDELYEENEEKYKALSNQMLEESTSEESGSESGDEASEESEDEEAKQTIIDTTETNLVTLRRVIYLTIQSSLDFEECTHKILKLELKPGQEVELCNMVLDCCAQLRTYEKFYGLIAQRLCQIDKKFVEPMQNMFKEQYETIHRLETDKLRNIGRFFAHLLHTDAISWGVLSICKLTEEDTTSASRIFLKVLFQELSAFLGVSKLSARLQDPSQQVFFDGILPRDNPQNTRFAINFFTTIGLGGLTEELREHLSSATQKLQAEKAQAAAAAAAEAEATKKDDSSDSSGSNDSESDSSDSDDSQSHSSSSDDSIKKREWKKTDKKGDKESKKKHSSTAKSRKGKENNETDSSPEKVSKKRDKSGSKEKHRKRKSLKSTEQNNEVEVKKRRFFEEKRPERRDEDNRRYGYDRRDQWNQPRWGNYGMRGRGRGNMYVGGNRDRFYDRPRGRWPEREGWHDRERYTGREEDGRKGAVITESSWMQVHKRGRYNDYRGRDRNVMRR